MQAGLLWPLGFYGGKGGFVYTCNSIAFVYVNHVSLGDVTFKGTFGTLLRPAGVSLSGECCQDWTIVASADRR